MSKNGIVGNTPQWNRNDDMGGCTIPDGAPLIKVQSRETTFCKDVTIESDLFVYGNTQVGADLCVAGNLVVGGVVIEGGSCGDTGEGDGEPPCISIDQLKIKGPFKVGGDSCMEKGLRIKEDLKVDQNASCENLKIQQVLEVGEAAQIGSDFLVSGKTQLSSDTQVLGKLHVGSVTVSCENKNLTEADFVVGGVTYTNDSIFCPDLVASNGVYAKEIKSGSIDVSQIIVNGKLYQEQSIEVFQSGVPVTLNVLVAVSDHTLSNPPNAPRVCPISVEVPGAPEPTPPCPEIDC